MLRKKRKKHKLPMVELNITSLMDILTTLLFFIIMVTSFTKFSVMDVTSMFAASPSQDQQKNVFSLKITIKSEKSAQLQLGAIQGLKMVDESRLINNLARGWKGSPSSGYFKTLYGKDFKQLTKKIQEAIIPIKMGFPHEHQAVLALSDKVKYQNIVDAMTNIRVKENGEPLALKSLVGKIEKSRVLFPGIILAEI